MTHATLEICVAGDGEADEDVDPNRDGGRRVRHRADPAAKAAADAAAAPQKPAAAAEGADRPREAVRISRQRWVYLQNHVLACLKQAEGGDMGGQAVETEVAAQKFVGLSQHDIIKWHIRTEIEKCATHTACHFDASSPTCIICPSPALVRGRSYVAQRNVASGGVCALKHKDVLLSMHWQRARNVLNLN